MAALGGAPSFESGATSFCIVEPPDTTGCRNLSYGYLGRRGANTLVAHHIAAFTGAPSGKCCKSAALIIESANRRRCYRCLHNWCMGGGNIRIRIAANRSYERIDRADDHRKCDNAEDDHPSRAGTRTMRSCMIYHSCLLLNALITVHGAILTIAPLF
ncbi:MAG: hypothetical protein JWO50_207 [Candidatus Kaiserbacteria bacterium]|nr:hypothetical protein [Candidatus Kaiserbacteria bacterium]